MSKSLYPETSSLRFWSEEEILLRNNIVSQISLMFKNQLFGINHSWKFFQMEGPLLCPRSYLNENYTDDDIFVTNHSYSGQEAVLRAETTPTTYQYAKSIMATGKAYRAPICFWQVGKSFRRELSDGASASKMRYNEFYQLEFQAVYSNNTMADYRALTLPRVASTLGNICAAPYKIVDSDRLPAYSESTKDIELKYKSESGREVWREVCSASIRNDFDDNHKVFELAIGLDRLIDIASINNVIG